MRPLAVFARSSSLSRTLGALGALGVLTTLGVGCAADGSSGRAHLQLPGRSDSRPFSHAVVAGNTVYVAGTLGLDPATQAPPADAAEEARLALNGIRDKLALAGLGMDDLVSVQVFCPDLELYDTFNTVYAGYFRENYPARAFVGSGPLLRGCRFEINAVAVRP